MNLRELKKLLENSTEENIYFDDLHINLRCEENNIRKESLIQTLLKETNKLTHFIEDRQNVYKSYFKLNERRQLKIIIDILKPKKIVIRTIKILDRKLYKNMRIINLKRRRF